jgi:transposase InsO family protein
VDVQGKAWLLSQSRGKALAQESIGRWISFTCPHLQGYKKLVFTDTFTGWIEAPRMERASEEAKALLKEIIPRFGLPQTLQTDNGPTFISQVTKEVVQALGIKYHLHSAWRPQSSSKIERANQTSK